MNLEIEPYVGIGPVLFGMTRQQVRALIAAPVREFMKSPQSSVPADAFAKAGIYVFYSDEGCCEAVEVTRPSVPTLFGKSFVGQPYDRSEAWFRERDPNVETDEAGLTSRMFGVGVYSEGAKSRPSEPIEAVIAFRRGYYESRDNG
jgi:hypothetical protein